MVECDLGGERSSDARSVGNDVFGSDAASCGQVMPGRFGILSHRPLAGVDVRAQAVAAIVEAEDVQANSMKGRDGVVEIGKRAVAAWKEQDSGGCVSRLRSSGDPC